MSGKRPVALVLSYSDRSGIQAVWGPFPDVETAELLAAELRDVGLSGLWETYMLRMMKITTEEQA
jgi:hypothetical protein